MFGLFKSEKNEVLPVPQFKANYNEDFKFLNELIATFVDVEKFKLSLSDRMVVTDADVIDMAKNVTNEVLKLLGPRYKESLFNYINVEHFEEYVASIITQKVVELALNYNIQKM